MNLYYFFKNNPCRRGDLFEIEETLDLEELVLLPYSVQMVVTDTCFTEIDSSKGSCKETD